MNTKQNEENIKKLIEKHTVITNNHMTPELKLHLLTKECKLYNEKYDNERGKFFNQPFWSIYWPGGQALTRYIIDNGLSIIEKKRYKNKNNIVKVLDIGCGCGASSIAAKIIGADYVLANDIDEGLYYILF